MAVLVVPWRPGDAHREAAWQWLRSRYEAEGWDIVTGTCEGPWIKAHAVADALTHTDADRFIVADADCYCDGLRWAFDKLDEFPWAIPHHTVYRLTQEATAAVIAGGPLEGETTQHPYKGYAGGGFMAVHRDVYERAPLDPRFVGWGQEDSAWHLALSRSAGRGIRGRADCWHLWHPPQPRLSRQVGSEESSALLHRYQQARTPEAMAALLAEVTDGREDRREPQGRARAAAVA